MISCIFNDDIVCGRCWVRKEQRKIKIRANNQLIRLFNFVVSNFSDIIIFFLKFLIDNLGGTVLALRSVLSSMLCRSTMGQI